MGFGELVLILILVLLFLGAGKLPGIGEALGKSLRGLKDALKGEPPAKAPDPEVKKELPPRSGAPRG
ncbi:MAG TPA: twin-arginine translocase TatA/TatE family subunit [Anaeromyxobacter sp.]